MRELYCYVYGHPVFVVIMLLVMFIVYGVAGWFVYRFEKKHSGMKILWKLLIWLEIAACLVMFFYASLFSRDASEGMRYKLELFWSYKIVLRRGSSFYMRQILYNIMAFMPLGHAFYFTADKKAKWQAALLTFLVISLGIELIQLVFHLGLFEFDDIFDNVLGGMIGFGVAAVTQGIIEKNGHRCLNGKKHWRGRGIN